MMSRSIKFSCVLIAALSFAACGDDSGDGTGAPAGDGGTAGGCGTDTYANYGMAFFKKNCTDCHSAAIDLSNMGFKFDAVADIRTHKAHIIEHVVELKEPIMPMTGALPAADREKLKKWLDCGSP
jgi:hypothetical protein